MSSYTLFKDCYSMADGDEAFAGYVDIQLGVDHGAFLS